MQTMPLAKLCILQAVNAKLLEMDRQSNLFQRLGRYTATPSGTCSAALP
jgi:hypothetical protein